MKKETKNLIIGSLISLVAVYLLFPNNFEMSIYPIQHSKEAWLSLDPSWVSGLNYINLKELVWGKDFAFTLGPLSYLSTRVGWGQNKFAFLFFDIFIAINFFIIFFINFTKSNNKLITSIFIIVISIIAPLYFGALCAFILLSFLLFWIRESIYNNSYWAYLFQIIILVLLFYIKFNTGLISFVLFSSAILYKLIFKREKTLILITWFLLPIIVIYFISILLNVSIKDYVLSALQIISGYNEIMYLDTPFRQYIFALVLIFLSTTLLLSRIYKATTERAEGITIALLFLISLYVLFKQSFVRADDSHIREFYYSFLLLLFCGTDICIKKINRYTILPLLFLIIIPINFVYKLDSNAFPIKEKASKNAYIEGFLNFTATSGFHLFPNDNQLPKEILNKIGNNTVDAYPWNTQLLLENKLNFLPRPVFQSYTAYTPDLEEKNFEHYNSKKAPKYVIYDFCSVDNRYPLFDETKVNFLLKTNYICIDTITVNNRLQLLLEKKEDKEIKFVQTKEYAISLDSPLIPKEGIFYKVYLYNNIIGNMVSLVDHSPNISLSIVSKDGKTREYKTSKGLLETGLFGTSIVLETADMKDLISNIKQPQNEILAYYFKPKNNSFFKKKIRIKEYKITQ